jgi:UDP-3-O-[3-hydroxymyristoyl] glucosamine N-acyltransferase
MVAVGDTALVGVTACVGSGVLVGGKVTVGVAVGMLAAVWVKPAATVSAACVKISAGSVVGVASERLQAESNSKADSRKSIITCFIIFLLDIVLPPISNQS